MQLKIKQPDGSYKAIPYLKGDKGNKGDKGDPGPQGPPGEKGDTGGINEEMLAPIIKTVFGNTGNLSLAEQKPAVLHIGLSKDFTINKTTTATHTPSSEYPYTVHVDPLNCWDSSQNAWRIPATGFYVLSASLVYTNDNHAGLLTRINRSDVRDDSVATNFYFYNNNRSDGKQFVSFTKVIYFKQGDMLSIISKADGYTPTTLYKDFFGIKTEVTVALLTGL